MDVQMVDQEPQRSVQLIRRIDTRIPTPLLSTSCGAPLPGPTLGKLATNMRGAPLPKATPAPAAPLAGRGWTSVVNRSTAPTAATPASQSASSAWSRPAANASRVVPAPKVALSTSAPGTPAPTTGDVPDSWEDDL
jgi:transcriptional repressor NF-X1